MIPAAITLGTLALVGVAVLLDRLPSPPTDCTCPRCDAGGSCGGAQ